MTRLNKAVYREVELDGNSYIVGLDPDGPSLTIRKKRYHETTAIPLDEILAYSVEEVEEDEAPLAGSFIDLNEDEEAELSERKGELQLGEREIDPTELEMWAKTADKKFAVAWQEYKKVRSKYNVAQIVWRLNGSIAVREIPVSD